MKKTKILLLGILSVIMACCMLFVSCGGASTYTASYKGSAEFTTNSYHGGYLAAVVKDSGTYVRTLEIDGDKYTLTKEVTGAEGELEGKSTKVKLTFTFSGTCTKNGDTVVLSVPTKCVWNEDWAGLAAYGALTSGSGTATSINDQTANGDVIFNLFSGEFLNFTSPEEQTVKLSGETFTYAE